MVRRTPAEGIARQLKNAGAVVSAELADGRWLGVAVDRILVVGPEGVQFSRPWTDAESASWNGDQGTLIVRWIDGAGPLALRAGAEDIERTISAVHERVTASQVHVEILKTEAGGDIRAFIRRGPDGALFSQLTARGPLTDEERIRADELERRARDAVGL